MESSPKEYVVRNGLSYAYDALRSKERFIGESTTSHYENYFQQLAENLGPPGKKWDVGISNSEVESFYLGRVSLGEFRLNTQKRVFAKVPGWEFAPFSTLVWSQCRSVPDKVAICSKLDAGIGRQIWEIFIYLDTDSQAKIHVDDLCDLIQRVLRENGHVESEQNIKEWFCEETLIDFWSFFAAIVENYAGLLKPNIIRTLHELVTSEVLLCGKLTKKGHKIHSWKERWFTLQPTQISYFESQENMLLKGTISIGAGSQFEYLPDTKGRPHRFRLLDSQTQVPYEICTPDSDSLQLWNNAIKIAVAMNQVNGTNFLHRLSLAQKHVFPESIFSINPVTPCVVATPSSPSGGHQPVVGSKSVPLTKVDKNSKPGPRPPSPYNQSKSGAPLSPQASLPLSREPDGNLNDPPPLPPQRYVDMAHVVSRQNPRRGADVKEKELKARRRHSSITGSSEYEREREREMDKFEHVNVGEVMYTVVAKTNKGSLPDMPDRVALSPVKERSPLGKEERRILPRTPSPSTQTRGYAQLEFQNGTSNMHTPVPTPVSNPLPTRTRWNYTTVVFEKDAQKEKEFEMVDENKKHKPLPPLPGMRSSTSDSNIIAPQPVPRQRKPQSLTDMKEVNGREHVDFSSPTSVLSQNGGNGVRRELPRLPPKDDTVSSPTQYNKPTPRPRPAPRPKMMSPATETPPPVPARRSPIQPTQSDII